MFIDGIVSLSSVKRPTYVLQAFVLLCQDIREFGFVPVSTSDFFYFIFFVFAMSLKIWFVQTHFHCRCNHGRIIPPSDDS